jgi:hypothetical protein
MTDASQQVALARDARLAAFDANRSDGRVVHIRPIRKANEAEPLQALDRLSPDARYMRFMRVVREVNLKRMRQVVSSFPEQGDAIVATGAGLRRLPLKAFINTARRVGLKEMEGFVLAANQPMLGLANRLGFTIAQDPEDASVRLCRLPLQGVWAAIRLLFQHKDPS